MSQRPQLGCLLEIVETLALTLIIFVVIQNFIAQPYKVQQSSMERTLMQEQYVLVDKLTPRFDSYKRGDIVVFTPPDDWVGADHTPFIKRKVPSIDLIDFNFPCWHKPCDDLTAVSMASLDKSGEAVLEFLRRR